jgi:hypothetical protein
MSLSLSNVEQTLFDAEVKKAYQSKGFILRDYVRLRNDVNDSIVSFRKVGSVTADPYGFQSAVVYQDPNYNKVNVTLEPYRAATLIDDVERFLVNFDERQEDAMLLAMALGRRSDQLIIDALDASGTTNTIAAGGTGLTFAKVREVVKFFNELAVPPEHRVIAISAEAESDLMAEDEFTSSFYINLDAIKNGGLNGNFAMGMMWKVIPTMTEGGLPLSGDIRTCFAWHKLAMGMGVGRNFSTQIERVAHLDSWQVLGKIFANAVAVDAVGIVSVDVDESV